MEHYYVDEKGDMILPKNIPYARTKKKVKNELFKDEFIIWNVLHDTYDGTVGWAQLKSKFSGKLYWMSARFLNEYINEHKDVYDGIIEGTFHVFSQSLREYHTVVKKQSERCPTCKRVFKRFYVESSEFVKGWKEHYVYNKYGTERVPYWYNGFYGCEKCGIGEELD